MSRREVPLGGDELVEVAGTANGILAACRAAGVPVQRSPAGGYLVPGWASDLWAYSPIGWETAVLTEAQRDPETRAALVSILMMGRIGAEHAISVWCKARWSEGPAACGEVGRTP